MNKIHIPSLILLVCLYSTTLWASSYVFERFTQAHGLIWPQAHNLLQDRDGYLWLGTEAGLIRYDGYQFEVFQLPAEQPGAEYTNRRVKVLAEDANGSIWAAAPIIPKHMPFTNTIPLYAGLHPGIWSAAKHLS